MVSWLRKWRRKKILATPFPSDWLAHLKQNVVAYDHLTPREQAKLRDDLRVFIAEKNWEGCAGLELTDEMKVTIAGQACLMALGLEGDPFACVLSILVYPTGYAVPQEHWYEGWSIAEEAARLGESWYRGPVILSWADVRRDARHPGEGQNLVWHEFAHQLDMLDRSTNGTPPLADREQRRRWHDVMTSEYEQLVTDEREGRATLLDTYGATNEAEFFAVATECFFDCPILLRSQHPKLYELLGEYYRQDPAARWKPSA
ncbi:MAG: zinc-dependent peptidase [Planctomycetia bacterium]|nr:zinc-dependent peptidase [Planctomycetia bacterium]